MGKLVITVRKLFPPAFCAMSGVERSRAAISCSGTNTVAIKLGVFFLKPKELPGGNLNWSKAPCAPS